MSADIKRKGVSDMNKKLNLLVMLVSLLALILAFGSCDDGSGGGGGGGNTGTFRIKITDIPPAIMDDGRDGLNLIGLYPANTTTYATANALAGRDTSLDGDDKAGSDWYEFSMYNLTPGSKYVGLVGNYDIAFINTSTNVGKVLKNRRIEVSQLNTFSYINFVDP
jgi:hypothetical protein